MEYIHKSVLLNETIEYLDIKPDGVYLDGTLGGGGHSLEIVKRLQGGRLYCTDKDKFAIEKAGAFLGSFSNVNIIWSGFENAKSALGDVRLDGVLLDLGVSSFQLDDESRGFSYMKDAPLDMRMNREMGFSAWDLVNGYSEEELSRIIFEYGEERYARKIASRIVEKRRVKSIDTTFELVTIIKSCFGSNEKQHPAKRTFQAIRIAVNDELGLLWKAVLDLVSMLKPGGRICVITFHSLEDRLIKNCFKSLQNPCDCPRELMYCVCGKKPELNIVTRKPIIPSEQEVSINPRSRSAKLRVGEKI